MPDRYWRDPRCKDCHGRIRFVKSARTGKPFPLELHTSDYMLDPAFTTMATFDDPTSGEELVRTLDRVDDEPFDDQHELFAVPHRSVCPAVPGRHGHPPCTPRRRREEVASRG